MTPRARAPRTRRCGVRVRAGQGGDVHARGGCACPRGMCRRPCEVHLGCNSEFRWKGLSLTNSNGADGYQGRVARWVARRTVRYGTGQPRTWHVTWGILQVFPGHVRACECGLSDGPAPTCGGSWEMRASRLNPVPCAFDSGFLTVCTCARRCVPQVLPQYKDLYPGLKAPRVSA